MDEAITLLLTKGVTSSFLNHWDVVGSSVLELAGARERAIFPLCSMCFEISGGKHRGRNVLCAILLFIFYCSSVFLSVGAK